MSVKELIFETINSLELEIPLAYGFSDELEFPKLIYFHVNSTEIRQSNKKRKKHHIYQLNFYDVKAHDLDDSETLEKIKTSLEDTTLNTGTWQEVIDVDSETKESQFMYYLEIFS